MADDKVKPKIDDAFWFTYSESLVNKHQQERNEAAGKLQNLVLWLWGIYTTFASVGFALAGKDLTTGTKILISAASGALIVVYWLTVWAQMPMCLEFDPRSPTEIKEAYEKSVKAKAGRLNLTIFVSLIASVLVTSALVVASTTGAVNRFTPVFNAAIMSTGANVTAVAVNAKVGDAGKVLLSVEPTTPSAPDIFSYIVLPGPDGSIQCSVSIKKEMKEANVSLEWETKDAKKIKLTQRVAAVSSVKPITSPRSSAKAAAR